jgi:hypothetical protein
VTPEALATTSIINSTITGNAIKISNGGAGTPAGLPGDGAGGGIFDAFGGPLTLASDTIDGNSSQQGGNLDVESQPLTIADTILSGGALSGQGAVNPNC